MASIDINGNFVASVLRTQIDTYKNNPTKIIAAILQHAKDTSSGAANFVDPTMPAVMILEASCVLHASFIDEDRSLTRQQYPMLAITEDEIYNHASDGDFLDRFAQPASQYFSFLINKNDLMTKMLPYAPTGGKRVTIARNTEVSIGDYTFSLQYPINIDQLSHGDIQFSFDATQVSPLKSLSTSIIDTVIKTDTEFQEWYYFEVELDQFKVTSNEYQVTASRMFEQSVTLTDSFHYARVFYKRSTVSTDPWIEMVTTHSQTVYDLLVPTATLRMADGVCTVVIPQLYITNDMVGGSLRVDIYETKGAMSLVTDSFTVEAFQTKFRNISKSDSSVYTAAMQNINTKIYCANSVIGGSAAMSVTDFRNRIVDNAVGTRKTPITNAQVEQSQFINGYEIVKDRDYITNRVFLATKPLPDPTNTTKLITAGSATMETLIASIGDLSNTSLFEVAVNTNQITLKPELVYRNNNSVIEVLNKNEVALILSLNEDDRATFVNSQNLLYSPFHYVLDYSSNEFQARIYFLTNPLTRNIRFNGYNETCGFTVSTQIYTIAKTASGYTFQITTKSNAAYAALSNDEVFAQLSFIPPNDSNRCTIKSQPATKDSDGNRLFTFYIETNYDINALDQILLLNLHANSSDIIDSRCELDKTFDIVYGTNAVKSSTWSISQADAYLNAAIENPGSYAITYESVEIKMGAVMDKLWSQSKSVVEPDNYEKYTHDVYAVYAEDVYVGDRITVNGDGTITYNTPTHLAGDTINDPTTGLPVVLYHAGDARLGIDGNPILLGNTITRMCDIMMIEGSYLFATDSASTLYRQQIPATIETWMKTDLASISQMLFDKSKIFLYPKKTTGFINVFIDDVNTVQIEAGQSFKVVLHVDVTVYNDVDLRASLETITVKTIGSYIGKAQVSVSEIKEALRTAYGGDVIGITMSLIGGLYEVITVADNSERLGIRKILTKLPNNSLIVTEAVDITYVKVKKV